MQLCETIATLKKQKSEFKQFCREEKTKLDGQLAQLDQELSDSSNRQEKLAELNQQLASLERKHDKVKQNLATANKDLVRLQRRFDEIPGRVELGQYQKRFMELYNQCRFDHNVRVLLFDSLFFRSPNSIAQAQ